jgi:hypothetical protein
LDNRAVEAPQAAAAEQLGLSKEILQQLLQQRYVLLAAAEAH